MRFFNKDNAKHFGKQGGDANFSRHGRDGLSKAGKANVEKNGIEQCRAAGRALVLKYGTKHMQQIGRLGFQVVCDKYYGGNREALMMALHERGLLNTADNEMRAMIRLYQERLPGIFDDL